MSEEENEAAGVIEVSGICTVVEAVIISLLNAKGVSVAKHEANSCQVTVKVVSIYFGFRDKKQDRQSASA